jgi:hypothetical protein
MEEPDPFSINAEIELIKGLAGPRAAALIDYARAWRDRLSVRRARFAETVIQESGLSPEELINKLVDNEEFASLFEAALDASARSAYEQRLQLLARVVSQAANDIASVDDAQLVAATIRDLHPPHVRALTILGDYREGHPLPPRKGGITLRPSNPGGVTGSAKCLVQFLHTSTHVADAISATLERQGLIWNEGPGHEAWDVTDYGLRILDLLRSTDSKTEG